MIGTEFTSSEAYAGTDNTVGFFLTEYNKKSRRRA